MVKRRYCTSCGDRIDDDDIRAWHNREEHPYNRGEPLFCLFCGEWVPYTRSFHYDNECTNYPGRVGSNVP